MNLISKDIEENKAYLEKTFFNCSDLVFRRLQLRKKAVLAVFFDGLVEKERANSSVFRPLLLHFDRSKVECQLLIHDIKRLAGELLSTSTITEVDSMKEIINQVILGNLVLLVDGETRGISVRLVNPISRQIEQTEVETAIRGPQTSFNEMLPDNIGLIRKIIKNPALKMESFEKGTRTRTRVILSYMENIAEQSLVDEIKKRLERIEIDEVMEANTLAELLQDAPLSLVPQTRIVEKPDTAAAVLLEGRVVILMDGSPGAIIIPTVFKDFLEAAEDSYETFQYSTFIRVLRYALFAFSLFGSALFIAFTTFHQEMIPPVLLRYIIKSRTNVPIPLFVEILLQEFIYEMIREAGARLPQQTNKSILIVAALVLVIMAGRAQIVSLISVIVVAFSAISSFVIPYYGFFSVVRLGRFLFILAAPFWGMYGLIALNFAILAYLTSIRSFGIPFLTPFAPFSSGDLKDSIIRTGQRSMTNRPFYISHKNRKKQDTGRKQN